MTRQEYVHAVMSADGDQVYDSGQVQKLFFLLDRKHAEKAGGPWFNFKPEGFGPFDVEVYHELEGLRKAGLVSIYDTVRGPTIYRLTPKGWKEGQTRVKELHPKVADYIHRASDWMRGLKFFELVAAVNHEYPDMAVNTVFRRP